MTVAALTGSTTVLAVLPGTTFNTGTNITLTATVTPVSGSVAATGTVTFYVGTTSLGTATLSAGVATLNTTALTTPGAQNLTAQYGGDGNWRRSISAPVGVSVTPPVATLALAASPGNTSTVNQAVTFTATLGGVSFTPTAPSGNVSFTANGTAISGCSAVAVSGTTGIATCTTSALAVGANAIAARYAGDPNFPVASPATATQTVSAFAAGLGLVAAPGNPVMVNTSLTFTASLTGTGIAFQGPPIVPSGTVKFTAGGTTIAGCGAVAIGANGKASCTTAALAQGSKMRLRRRMRAMRTLPWRVLRRRRRR